jgi:hypothetical protein
MSKFDDFTDAISKGAVQLAKGIFPTLVSEATEDTKAFLAKTKADIEQWTQELADGKLTKQDFTDLIQAKKAVAEIQALTEAGAAEAALEKFRTGLIDLIVNTAFTVFL